MITKETVLQKMSVVIPSYQPDEKLEKTVKGVIDTGFQDIIVIDDGGGEKYAHIFSSVRTLPGVTVLTHEKNRGKGAALKTAFNYILENRPQSIGAVTADGDGQHLPNDILSCAMAMVREDKLVLGVRDFSLPDVPPRSRAGNRITCFVFLAFCGLKVTDTQTGLRAIPRKDLPAVAKIEGDRYEYETNMLLAAKNIGAVLYEEKISTVYIEENQTSHFNTVKDSFRIYKLIFSYMASSYAASLVDLLAFYLIMAVINNSYPQFAHGILTATVLARVISSLVNYTVNKNVVFGADCPKGAIFRYYALAVPVMLSSFLLVYLIQNVLAGEGMNSLVTTLIKAVVDIFIFFVTFRVQREWVFKKKN